MRASASDTLIRWLG